jgi:alpha-N-acetylglucosamine transferase
MSQRRVNFLAAIAFILLFLFFAFGRSSDHQSARPSVSKPGKESNAQPTIAVERLAYATYLSSTIKRTGPDDNDRFFVTARMLCWQILHAPETRTNRSIPFLVLVDPGVSQSKRDRLERDGAKVIPVGFVRPKINWIKPVKDRYADVTTKLRLWELEGYSRVLFIDSDTMLSRPLDGVFDEESTQGRYVTSGIQIPSDEAPLPSAYVMAGVLEVPSKHNYPPDPEDYTSQSYFNAGFFVCSPSRSLFEYYLSVLSIPDRFNSELPEQNLLNYAHRDDGPMPFQRISSTWNIRNPNDKDIDGGVASVHEKVSQ